MISPFYRFNSLAVFVLIAGLSGCLRFGDDQANGHIQDVRSRVMKEFFDDRDAAAKKYKTILISQSSISMERIEVAERIVASGQLLRYDGVNASKYLTIVNSALNSSDPGLRSLAIAALAYDSGEQSLLKLFGALDAEDELVQMEALSALKYRYASPAENEARGMAFMAERSTEFCGNAQTKNTFTATEFCNYISHRN